MVQRFLIERWWFAILMILCNTGFSVAGFVQDQDFILTFCFVNWNSHSCYKDLYGAWADFIDKEWDLPPLEKYIIELWSGLHLTIVTILKEQNSWAVFFSKKCSGLFVEMQDFYENSFCMEIFVILFINKYEHVFLSGVWCQAWMVVRVHHQRLVKTIFIMTKES